MRTSVSSGGAHSPGHVVMPMAILVLYFVVPVDAQRAPVGVLLGVLLSAAALMGVVAVVVAEARGARRLEARHFIIVLEVAVVVFAFVFYLMPFVYPLFSLLRGLEFPMVTSPVMPCCRVLAAAEFLNTAFSEVSSASVAGPIFPSTVRPLFF